MYPLVRELDGDRVPGTVTCRVLSLTCQPKYRCLAGRTASSTPASRSRSAVLLRRVLGASSPGYYRYKNRPASATQLRRDWLTGLIREIHVASRGTYGYRRIDAELTMAMNVRVNSRPPRRASSAPRRPNPLTSYALPRDACW